MFSTHALEYELIHILSAVFTQAPGSSQSPTPSPSVAASSSHTTDSQEGSGLLPQTQSPPTPAPQDTPISTTPPRPPVLDWFADRFGLRQAIVEYLKNPTPGSAVALQYGHPIGTWCVIEVINPCWLLFWILFSPFLCKIIIEYAILGYIAGMYLG